MSPFTGSGTDMANELRQLRLSRQIPAKEMVAIVRQIYPKYDKTVQSKCENTQDYGTVLAADAMETLYKYFGKPPPEPTKSTRHGKHRYACRITCRLPDADYKALQQRIKAEGYSTMQDWLANIVHRYLQEGGDKG